MLDQKSMDTLRYLQKLSRWMGTRKDCSESSLPLLSSFIYFLFIYLTHCTVTLLQGLWCSFGHIMVNKQASFLCVCVVSFVSMFPLIFILLFYLLSSLSTPLFPLTIFIFFISSTSISVFLLSSWVKNRIVAGPEEVTDLATQGRIFVDSPPSPW